MAIKYKQLCNKCKKNFIIISRKQNYILCYDCQKKELSTEIKDSEMKKFFDIPEEFYKENFFLRNIKSYYIRHNELTEKQKQAFKKTVERLKSQK